MKTFGIQYNDFRVCRYYDKIENKKQIEFYIKTYLDPIEMINVLIPSLASLKSFNAISKETRS